jgi:lycopene cyclase domain-containing protein
VWDVIFTSKGVWSFNRDYLIGLFFLQLPIEEWLFFITVPYSCVFIYEALNYYIKKDYLKKYAFVITLVLVGIMLSVAFLHINKLYTSVTLIFASTFLLFHWFLFKDRYLGRFYMAYLVHLIPFFIVNGILTRLPVVIYNNAENLGIRLYTIPIEDTMYSLLLLLMNITFYEWLKGKFLKDKSDAKS